MKLELNESANFARKTPSFSSVTLIPLLKFLGKKPLSYRGSFFVYFFRAARAFSFSPGVAFELMTSLRLLMILVIFSVLGSTFLDVANEPTLGTGTIEVTELTELGCPDCLVGSSSSISSEPFFALFFTNSQIFPAMKVVRSPLYVFTKLAIILYTLLSYMLQRNCLLHQNQS